MFLKIGVWIVVMSLYLSATSYLSNATCSSTSYHVLKNEINLDSINNKVAEYRAEAFVSFHIYIIDKTRDIGEEFQFGKNNTAKLLEYSVDDKSGFEAGLYKINNERLIIAFGGTTSKEKYAEGFAWNDIDTDSVLLSNRRTSYQVNAAAIFLQQMQVKYPNQDITATGHSLGGGLAQFAGLMSKEYAGYKKIKAVTFNTAPMPLSNLTKKWVDDLDENLKWADANNVNFMANNDPLTNILKSAEAHDGHTLIGFKINTGIELLDNWLNSHDVGIILKKGIFYVAQIYMNQTVRDLKKLIYGKRIILDTDTGHPMFSLLTKIAPNYASYGSFRHGFVDVPVGNDGYCKVLKLMKSHVISYPRSEREYKYYPNQNTTNYEVALYMVNNFYYISYRNALKNNPSLTKFNYFVQLFSTVTGVSTGMNKDSVMSFRTFNAVMQIKYKKSLSLYLFKVDPLDKEQVLKELLEEIDKSMFSTYRFSNTALDKAITRMQMTKWIADSLYFNYYQLITKKSVKVKAERLQKFKTKGSTDNLFKLDVLGY
ncbi:MAG: Unknown protein [uncultured Sulfurovum sp.]|uniref:Uncharacterized protein n=1 Tax=uncultured Sulfurovum sp. TaxID=269237 RepID=A0A6S6S1S3_9BACT|nr:MAG: Unknown protein [uncultured Sulfurovum sp.]